MVFSSYFSGWSINLYSADSYDMADRALFMDFAETMLVGYSEDEQNLLYDAMKNLAD